MIAIPHRPFFLVPQCRDCKAMDECPSIKGGMSFPESTRCRNYITKGKRHEERATKEAIQAMAKDMK